MTEFKLHGFDKNIAEMFCSSQLILEGGMLKSHLLLQLVTLVVG